MATKPTRSTKDSTVSTSNAVDQSLTLSAAILSPINSLFEVQVHAARAFLSFILQMGFGDKVTHEKLDTELESLENQKSSGKDEYGKTLSDADYEAIDQKRTRVGELKELLSQYDEYQSLKEEQKKGELMSYDQSRLETLQALKAKFESANLKEDVHTLKFKYVDGSGSEHHIVIPALALIPVQPLAISKATFDFSLAITSHSKNFKQQQDSRMGSEKRPWYFIQPRRIEGVIHSEASIQSRRGIKIHIEVNSTPIPQGLSNLLSSLTQSARVETK